MKTDKFLQSVKVPRFPQNCSRNRLRTSCSNDARKFQATWSTFRKFDFFGFWIATNWKIKKKMLRPKRRLEPTVRPQGHHDKRPERFHYRDRGRKKIIVVKPLLYYVVLRSESEITFCGSFFPFFRPVSVHAGRSVSPHLVAKQKTSSRHRRRPRDKR